MNHFKMIVTDELPGIEGRILEISNEQGGMFFKGREAVFLIEFIKFIREGERNKWQASSLTAENIRAIREEEGRSIGEEIKNFFGIADPKISGVSWKLNRVVDTVLSGRYGKEKND